MTGEEAARLLEEQKENCLREEDADRERIEEAFRIAIANLRNGGAVNYRAMTMQGGTSPWRNCHCDTCGKHLSILFCDTCGKMINWPREREALFFTSTEPDSRTAW